MNLTERYATALSHAGADVIVDDRDQRPGVKFKDCDLIGFPLRVVIGEKGVAGGTIELKWRTGGDAFTVPLPEGPDAVIAVWNARREEHAADCRSRISKRDLAKSSV
ncbi:MAG: His/Gly/Thr/Pro-type tRNA ligase C-terminal domain-containing protein [Isosphaeraceae bacterium]